MGDPHPPGDPWSAAVHRVHDRYLVEVVEELDLCPFARRCRETARLNRPIFRVSGGRPTPAECAARLAEIARRHPDLEVVLMTFVLPAGHPLFDAGAFDCFQQSVRAEAAIAGAPRFYMVGFHPASRCAVEPAALRPHNMAPLLRRTPDPVIQCVRADLLDRVREDTGRWARVVEGEPDYEIRAMLERSLSSSSQVSDDIALKNYLRVGSGEGRQELERRLADIHADRDRSYGSAL